MGKDLTGLDEFEYKTLELKEKGLFVTKFSLEDLDDELNYQGKRGWELVSSFATVLTD